MPVLLFMTIKSTFLFWVEVFNFGKNKGVPVEKVLKEQQGYYDWMIKSDFPLYTKKVLTKIKLRSSGLVKGV